MHVIIARVCHLLYTARYLLEDATTERVLYSCRLGPVNLLCYWSTTCRVTDLESEL
jgi:hypothetical protein